MATTTKATQDTSEEDLNKINLTLKSQPWYQAFFKQRGLDGRAVKLSGTQQQALTSLAAQNGYDLGDRIKFDASGNINQKGGFAGMPTWAKIAIAAAPIAATAGFGAAGMGPLAGVLGGSAAPAAGVGSGMAAFGPTSILGATGGGAAAGAGGVMSSIAGAVTGGSKLLGTAGRVVGQMGQASASNRGTTIDATMAHDELGLRADRERRDAESDAYRKSLYGQIAAGYQPSTRPTGVPSRTSADSFITPQAREAGQLMTDTAMQRMKTQDYPSITPLSQLPMKPGVMERIANYAGPALSLFDPRLYDENGIPHAR